MITLQIRPENQISKEAVVPRHASTRSGVPSFGHWGLGHWLFNRPASRLAGGSDYKTRDRRAKPQDHEDPALSGGFRARGCPSRTPKVSKIAIKPPSTAYNKAGRLTVGHLIGSFKIKHNKKSRLALCSNQRLETMRSWRFARWLPVVAICLGTAGPILAADPAKLAFNRDIRPILSDNCFRCHGFDKNSRQADLRLDIAEGALVETASGVKPIVAGKPEESELIRRVTTDDPDERMPPVESHQSLTPAQIATLKQWIVEGAEYEPHWSFVPPVEPAIPEVATPQFVLRNPIDHFIAAKLHSLKLTMSPDADKATLLRRATLDLTGLPPTLEELDAFLSDVSSDAYEKAVDRLLASPRYGERMVLEWLDAARYADTNGYQGDRTRTMWPWRDWVIRAMNSNMPFDQFTIEQLAGDLLANAAIEQRLATGFNRNHPLNGEGGRILEESRNDYVMDRVETTGTVWLGLTVGCCRCHDHKYDPLTQKEYYRLFAYFNNVAESLGTDPHNPEPVMRVVLKGDAEKLEKLKATFAAAESKHRESLAQIDAAQAEWEVAVANGASDNNPNTVWTVPEIVSAQSVRGAAVKLEKDSMIAMRGKTKDFDEHRVVLKTTQTKLTGLRLEALRDDKFPERGPGRAPNGNFVLTDIKVNAVSLENVDETHQVKLASASSSYAQPGFAVESAFDEDPRTGWAIAHSPNTSDEVAVFSFATPIGYPEGTELHISLHYESTHLEHVMGKFRLAVTSDEHPSTPKLPQKILAALKKPAEKRNKDERNRLRDYYRNAISIHPDQLALNSARKELDDLNRSIPSTMVMQDLPTPRETFVLDKGIYTKRIEKVEPGVIAAIHPADKEMPKTRLEFARWLVEPSHPLTARVAVNRYWQMFFGTGIVKTAEDFGVQGEAPSHPELLDWLAIRFIKSGWDVKAMHRLMVTSAAYRQNSHTTPELLERDPANRLLARGPRHRLPAYTIRDQALAVSGLLVEKLGGPPVKPYMAAGVWEDASIGKINYIRDSGEGLYRRSVYTFWRRIAAPAMLFDTSARSVCAVRLPRTNTPLQALILMNDVQYVEASRHLATRMMTEKQTPTDRIAFAFQLCTSRLPGDAEQKVLLDTYETMLKRYQTDEAAADDLTRQGDSPRPADLNVAELATYTTVASLILNFDETITKE